MFSWCWGTFPQTSTPGLQESPPHFVHVGDSPKCLPAGSSPSKIAGDTVLQWNSEPHHGRSVGRPTFPPELHNMTKKVLKANNIWLHMTVLLLNGAISQFQKLFEWRYPHGFYHFLW